MDPFTTVGVRKRQEFQVYDSIYFRNARISALQFHILQWAFKRVGQLNYCSDGSQIAARFLKAGKF